MGRAKEALGQDRLVVLAVADPALGLLVGQAEAVPGQDLCSSSISNASLHLRQLQLYSTCVCAGWTQHQSSSLKHLKRAKSFCECQDFTSWSSTSRNTWGTTSRRHCASSRCAHASTRASRGTNVCYDGLPCQFQFGQRCPRVQRVEGLPCNLRFDCLKWLGEARLWTYGCVHV